MRFNQLALDNRDSRIALGFEEGFSQESKDFHLENAKEKYKQSLLSMRAEVERELREVFGIGVKSAGYQSETWRSGV